MAEQPPVTDLEDVRAWVGSKSDQVEAAYEAAEAHVATRCTWPRAEDGTWPPAPYDLVQAVRMLTARFLARRNSPDGFLGMGELGVAQVPVVDRDIDRLMAPWRRVVLA